MYRGTTLVNQLTTRRQSQLLDPPSSPPHHQDALLQINADVLHEPSLLLRLIQHGAGSGPQGGYRSIRSVEMIAANSLVALAPLLKEEEAE
jgi:hypothetical protein